MTSAARHEHITDATITALVHTFYSRVPDDARLGPVFAARIAPDAWPAHLARMVDFWSTILLGSGRYRGNPLQQHRQIDHLDRDHFRHWLQLFEQVVRELFAPAPAELLIDRSQRMGQTLQAGLPPQAH